MIIFIYFFSRMHLHEELFPTLYFSRTLPPLEDGVEKSDACNKCYRHFWRTMSTYLSMRKKYEVLLYMSFLFSKKMDREGIWVLQLLSSSACTYINFRVTCIALKKERTFCTWKPSLSKTPPYKGYVCFCYTMLIPLNNEYRTIPISSTKMNMIYFLLPNYKIDIYCV